MFDIEKNFNILNSENDVDDIEVDIEGFINDKTQYYLKDLCVYMQKAEYTGTPFEIVEQYIKANGMKIEYTPAEDGDGYNIVLVDPQGLHLDRSRYCASCWADINDGSDKIYCGGGWTDINDGSDKESIHFLYLKTFCFFSIERENQILCKLEDAECFKLNYRELLEKITAREVYENNLCLRDEDEVREWYQQKIHDARIKEEAKEEIHKGL